MAATSRLQGSPVTTLSILFTHKSVTAHAAPLLAILVHAEQRLHGTTVMGGMFGCMGQCL